MLCGTGAHGAYHAGVLRALQEAGVKIDLVAGQGIGAVGAAFAAIDGSARLWEADGLWRGRAVQTFFAWKPLLRACGWILVLLALVLVTPVLVLMAGAAIYGMGFLLILLGLQAGSDLISACSAWLQRAFAPAELPLVVPRLALVILVALVFVAGVGLLAGRWRTPVRRRAEGRWWWDLAGAPLDAASARAAVTGAIWQLIRGASAAGRPSTEVVGRRYAEVLAESLGQPGFRELLAVATDLDSRRDVVISLLRDPFRRDFLAPRAGRDRRAEVLDLAASGRDHAIDVVTAAMTPPVACEPALVSYAADSIWRGEVHRLCDRPGSSHRLIEEVAAAGVTQVIVVTAAAPSAGPHRLHTPRLDPRHRLGEFLEAAESAALRDVLETARRRFDAVHVVSPVHVALGPFDFAGVYDEASDRRQTLDELVDRGYDDAYRQFIEPIVGGSGEPLAREAREEASELRLGF